MKNIDIVVPLFNEEEVVMEFFEALEREEQTAKESKEKENHAEL